MKLAIFALIALLTVYAPAELTWIIIRDMFPVYPQGQFIFEIALIWTFWLAGMIIIWGLLRRE